MATISSILSPTLLHYHNSTKSFTSQQHSLFSKLSQIHSHSSQISLKSTLYPIISNPRGPKRAYAVAEDTAVLTNDPSAEAARRLYVGNIPRTVNNEELRGIFEEHGAVEKVEVMYDKYSGRSRRFAFVTMKTIEDVNAAIEKLNGTQIGGREIKVNVTEKPLSNPDFSLLQAEESQFIDSAYKVYVGNLAKAATSEKLKNFFSEKGKVLSAKISRVPGTSKSRGFGFVSFSSEEDVEAAVSSLNNALFEGQEIRVNKA
ncbi:hypothetical protein LguiA_010655 [Lonicera macranthoides]